MRGRTLIAVQLVTLVVGLGAIYLAVTTASGDRHQARLDTCRLIVGLVRTTTPAGSPSRRRANVFIAHTVLRNCHIYANSEG